MYSNTHECCCPNIPSHTHRLTVLHAAESLKSLLNKPKTIKYIYKFSPAQYNSCSCSLTYT